MTQEFIPPKPWPKIRTVLFGNAKARTGQAGFKIAHDLLKHHQIPLEQAECFTDATEFNQQLKSAVNDKVDLAIIGGGDGTLNLAAQTLANSKTTLGVLPLGTGNQFALDIGLENNIPQAIDTILRTKIALIDAATVNDYIFINVATAGITSTIAQSLTFKKELGKLAYLPAAIKSLQESTQFIANLAYPNGTMTQEAVQLVACNGRLHGGPFVASPNANLTNGKLEIYIVKEATFWQIAQVGAFALTGDHADLDQVEFIRSSELHLKLAPRLPLIVDGEPFEADEYKLQILPEALKVLVPPTFEAPANKFTSFTGASSTTTDI